MLNESNVLSACILTLVLFVFAISSLVSTGLSILRRQSSTNFSAKDMSDLNIQTPSYLLDRRPASALYLIKIISFSLALTAMYFIIANRWNPDWASATVAVVTTICLFAVINKLIHTLAVGYATQTLLRIAILVRIITWTFTPLFLLEDKLQSKGDSSANSLAQRLGQENDLTLHLDRGHHPLDEHEARMIRGVFQLDSKVAREIMVPRVDVTATDLNTSLEDLAALMIREGHSKVPVFRVDLDHIEGVAYALDLLKYSQRNTLSDGLLTDIVRPAMLTPETKTLEDLLNEFQQKHTQMAVVVDEYGGVSGIVTIEDLVEEIVGELQDEFDSSEPRWRMVNENEYLMDAALSIDDLQDLLNLPFEGEGFDTVGGFVYHQLGKIPSPGDTVEYNGVTIEVVSTIGRRLKALKLIRDDSTQSSG